MTPSKVTVRALRTRQGSDTEVYAFFLPGHQVAQIADISRLRRGDGHLEGFQRREIKAHVSEITEFLSQGPVLFPNAIILALSPQVRFKSARGPAGEDELVRSGELTIPVRPEGQRAAWIVDGQQRSLALAKAGQSGFPVPVVAFVSDDVSVQREQFILVNKANINSSVRIKSKALKSGAKRRLKACLACRSATRRALTSSRRLGFITSSSRQASGLAFHQSLQQDDHRLGVAFAIGFQPRPQLLATLGASRRVGCFEPGLLRSAAILHIEIIVGEFRRDGGQHRLDRPTPR